jgi:hypothetical protein
MWTLSFTCVSGAAQAIVEKEIRSKARDEWIARKEGELKGLEAVLLARDRKLREREAEVRAYRLALLSEKYRAKDDVIGARFLFSFICSMTYQPPMLPTCVITP